MRKTFLLLLLILGFSSCTNYYRIRVDVERPPALGVKIGELHLKVEETSLQNDFVEIKNVREEVEKFLRNELETTGNIKVASGEGSPLLRVVYEGSLKRAYTYYSPPEQTVAPPTLVPVKIIHMKMCFTIKEYNYHKCIEERMKFREYESSIFALYSVLQRMTSSLLSDISYQKKEIMHYLLR